mgnify:FL=1
MSTDHVSRAARTAALLYPVVTVLALVLSFVLFIAGDGGSLTRTVVFMVWLALLVYSLIRVLSDVLSGQHKKARNFQNTLDAFAQNTGSPSKAMAYFTAMEVVSSVLKLAVPVVLWAIFR